jgi:3-phenylpropionate/trans-cinnamate dioxygenase ferredoxin subunit
MIAPPSEMPIEHGNEDHMPWIAACAEDDIEKEDVLGWVHGGRSFAIFRSPDDEFFCTDGLCTHEQVELSDGLVLDYVIECPRHNGQFDYRTGEAKRSPACENLRTYSVRREGGQVLVLVE